MPHLESRLNADALRPFGLDAVVQSMEPIYDGLSGAELARVTLCRPLGEWPNAPCVQTSHVVKRIIAETGWLAAATSDTRIREAALWRAGLPQWLPHRIALAVEQVAFAQGDGATPAQATLLMRDERSHLMRQPMRQPLGSQPAPVVALLDALAALHARFWQSPALGDPALGLASAHDTLLWLSPQVVSARIAAGDDQHYLPLALRGWESFFRLVSPAHAALYRAIFDDPAPALRGIESAPHTLVHGDIWGPNIGWLAPTRRGPRMGQRLLLLDWALATAGPAPYDVLSLCGAWQTLSPTRLLAIYRARLTRRLAVRGISLRSEQWRRLADAAYLRTTLTGGEAWARAVEDAASAPARQMALARLRWWAGRGADASRRLRDA